jgi:hypothetical protein
MADKKITIQSLLSEDDKKRLAELLLSDKISNMVIIYRKGDTFHVDVSDQSIASVLGSLEMAKSQIINGWMHPEDMEEHEFGDDA